MSQKSKPTFDLESYLLTLESARGQRISTLNELVEWVANLQEHAIKAYMLLEPFLDRFPRKTPEGDFRITTAILRTKKRYGAFAIHLRGNGLRMDLGLIDDRALRRVVSDFVGATEVEAIYSSIKAFTRLSERIAALGFLGVEFPTMASSGMVITRWFDALDQYATACRAKLRSACDRFIDLSVEVDQSIFEFNHVMGKLRYRSIRCSYTLDESDLLGPSNPTIKVVTWISRDKRQWRYTNIVAFKRTLRTLRIAKRLKSEFGRAASKEEIESAIALGKPRAETDWITKRVIKACYKGSSTAQILEAQEQLIYDIEPWSALRADLAMLLP